MLLESDYRPANIEFSVANNSIIPENLGRFESAKEATDFIHSNVVGVNQALTVLRFMDNYEKNELRKDYSDLLENRLPSLEKELQKAAAAHEQAKKELSEAKEYVSATINESRALAIEVKNGTKEIKLDDQFTWRLPFEGQFYDFTFIDNQLKLCKVSIISEDEKQNLWSEATQNETFFNDNFGVSNE